MNLLFKLEFKFNKNDIIRYPFDSRPHVVEVFKHAKLLFNENVEGFINVELIQYFQIFFQLSITWVYMMKKMILWFTFRRF
jgi:hypothetical protein